MNACPRCHTVLDEGPVLYRCPRCERGVYAADLNTEYQPRTIRVRLDREPWPVNNRATTLSDGKGVVAVLTDSIRVVETSRS